MFSAVNAALGEAFWPHGRRASVSLAIQLAPVLAVKCLLRAGGWGLAHVAVAEVGVDTEAPMAQVTPAP